MTASDRLNAAHIAAIEGRHEEALTEYIWFHNHALEEQPSLYGVRLSFALAYWMELAARFPKAKDVLEEIRDRKSSVLLEGHGNRELFHDIVSINDALGCPERTHVLFEQLATSNPTLADMSAKLALPSIIKVGDYSLAISHFLFSQWRVFMCAYSRLIAAVGNHKVKGDSGKRSNS